MLEQLPYFKMFYNSTFFNVVCINWKIKCWILLMHGVTMKSTPGRLKRNKKILEFRGNLNHSFENEQLNHKWQKVIGFFFTQIKYLGNQMKKNKMDAERGRYD